VPQRDSRDEKIEQLEAVIAELRRELAALRAENAELRARLDQNSQNSSRPPSSDPPGTLRPMKREASGRRRGGQPGHKKHERRLLPLDEVDHVEEIRPDSCGRCGGKLRGEDPRPLRHQVTDIPPTVAVVTEYRLHALSCTCGARTRAELPVGVPRSAFGPRLSAMMTLCSGAFRMSKRMVSELVRDCFGVEVSVGAVCEVEKRMSQALAEPWNEALDFNRKQPTIHADETGWREAKKRAWLWVVASTQVAVFQIQRSRGAKVIQALLTVDFEGILVADRWSAYAYLSLWQRQICWAHLIRHFVGFEEHGKQAKALGRRLQKQARRMFNLWHRVRDGTLRRSTFRHHLRSISRKILAGLESGTRLPAKKVAAQCREISALADALFTFARLEDVEPTNNHAERCLRPAVIWRKCCFGTDSEIGSRFVERVATAVTSLRLQHRNVLEFLVAASEAHLRGTTPPSLLPISSQDRRALAA